MTRRRFRTSADATRFNQGERGGRLARSITGKRSDRLVRNLREQLAPLREQDSNNPPARQFGYGLVELPTVRRFREIDSQGRLHQIHVIQGDAVDGVLAYIIEANSTAFVYPGSFPGQIRPDGEIFSGRFKDVGSQIRLFDGTQTQADPDLVAQTSVDSQFIGQGLAYIWSRFAFQEGRFNGDPNVRVIARSRKVVDPRSAVNAPTAAFETLPQSFSINPYRMIFDYLIRPVAQGGAGLPTAQIDVPSFVDSTDWSEIVVDTQQFTRTALLTTRTNQSIGTPPVSTNHLLEFNDVVVPFQYGDVVNISAGAGQSVPPNLTTGTDYHVIPVRHAVGDFQIPAVALALTLEDALNGVSIAQGNRTSDILVTKVGEVRYQTGVTYLSGEPVLDRMLESCGARLYMNDGKIVISSQRFPAAGDIADIPLSYLIGSIALSPKQDPDSRANALSGTFTSLTNLFLPSTYPVVSGDGVFRAQDNGEELLSEFNLPFAAKASVAQRLATIELRRRRQELSLAMSGDLHMFQLKPSTVFSVNFPKYGLDAQTTFEVRDQTLFLRVDNDIPTFGVNIEARQLESTTFDLDISNEVFVGSAVIPGLDSPFDVEAPGAPSISESLFQTRSGAGVRSQVSLAWGASPDNFVVGYQVSFKRSNNIDFIFLAETPDTNAAVFDLEPGLFDFQVQAVNSLGLKSDPALARSENVQVFGLANKPATPTGFVGTVISSSSVLLTWDLSPDLDVKEGGFVEIRHNPAISGALQQNSVLLVQDVGGQTSLIAPFKQGTYFLRFLDSRDQFSDAAEWSTQDRRPVEVAQDISLADIGGFTIQEDNTFPSTNPANTLVFVTDHLELPLDETWDDETDVDAIANVDDVGGGSVTPEGLYFFQTSLELAAVNRVVLETVLAAEIFDLTSSIDDEPDFDQITDVDSVAGTLLDPGAANAEMQVRFSNGIVASDTFGPWEKIDTGIFDARSFEFRILARSFVQSANIRITQARVRLRSVPLG